MSASDASRLVLTQHALQRHAKRLRAEFTAAGHPMTTAVSQETMARVIGLKNWHEAVQLCQAYASDGMTMPLALSASAVPPQGHVPLVGMWDNAPLNWCEGRELVDDLENYLRQSARAGFDSWTLQSDQKMLGARGGREERLSTAEVPAHQLWRCLAQFYGEALPDSGAEFIYELRPSTNEERIRLRLSASAIHQGWFVHAVRIAQVPQWTDLNIPTSLSKTLMSSEAGLCVFAGSHRSGRTTTMAALVRAHLERSSPLTVLTFESPIEYDLARLDGIRGTVASTEIKGQDARMVSSAMRRDPDIVMIGETSTPEMLDQAMSLGTTGHTVYTQVHGERLSQVFGRLVSAYAEFDRKQKAVSLASALRVMTAQRLLPLSDGRRLALREWLVIDDALRERLGSLPLHHLPEVFLDAMLAQKSRLRDDLERHHQAGLIASRDYNRLTALVDREDRAMRS